MTVPSHFWIGPDETQAFAPHVREYEPTLLTQEREKGHWAEAIPRSFVHRAPEAACGAIAGHDPGRAADVLTRWEALCREVNYPHTLYEREGVRDPEHPCFLFAPGEPAGNCNTDGHYLCGDCARSKPHCRVCGSVRDACDCETTGG